MRGAHLRTAVNPLLTLLQSPHTPGTPRARKRLSRRYPSIPAYAGNMLRQATSSYLPPFNPRSRGEHWTARIREGIDPLQSPLTRGTRAAPPGCRCADPSIPARAGHTEPCRAPTPDHPFNPCIRGAREDLSVNFGLPTFNPSTRGAHDTTAVRSAATCLQSPLERGTRIR